MKDYELLDAVGGISPEYIDSAEKSKEASEKRIKVTEDKRCRRSRFPMWTKHSLVAACVCLAVVGGMLINTGTLGGGTGIAPMGSADMTHEEFDAKTREAGVDMVQEKNGAIPKEAKADAPNDVSVDESTYSEERTYSPDIQSLQDRISDAMKNNELPFVVSSMILENPDRVHVTVNTADEESINLLRAYDPTGELLEIEYSTDPPVTE